MGNVWGLSDGDTHTIKLVGTAFHKIHDRYLPSKPFVLSFRELIKNLEVYGDVGETLTYKVPPNVDFVSFPTISICDLNVVGVAERGSFGVDWMTVRMYGFSKGANEANARVETFLFIHSDKVSEAIADYKEVMGIT